MERIEKLMTFTPSGHLQPSFSGYKPTFSQRASFLRSSLRLPPSSLAYFVVRLSKCTRCAEFHYPKVFFSLTESFPIVQSILYYNYWGMRLSRLPAASAEAWDQVQCSTPSYLAVSTTDHCVFCRMCTWLKYSICGLTDIYAFSYAAAPTDDQIQCSTHRYRLTIILSLWFIRYTGQSLRRKIAYSALNFIGTGMHHLLMLLSAQLLRQHVDFRFVRSC